METEVKKNVNPPVRKEALNKFQGVINEINRLKGEKKDAVIFQLEQLAKTIRLSNGDTIDGFIFKTSNINQFDTVIGNRIINEDSAYVRHLAESLKNIGNISPTIINENKQTIDGQRRMTAIRKFELNVPLRYTIVKGATIDTVGDLNRLQLNWNVKDWMHKYVSMGKPDYLEYQEIETKYEKYMRSRSLRSVLMNNRVESFSAKVWEEGQFKIDHSTKDFNLKFLDFLGKIYEIGGTNNIFARNREFQKAIYDIYRDTKAVDEKRMLIKFKNGFARLNVRVDRGEYRKIIRELYNSRLSKRNKDELVAA